MYRNRKRVAGVRRQAYRKTNKKNAYRRRRTKNAIYRTMPSKTIYKPLTLGSKWPQGQTTNDKRVILTYEDNSFDMSTALGGGYMTYNVFSHNSPYDPDVTGVGVQPYMYDIYLNADNTGLYQRYNCVASKITIYLSSTITTATCPMIRGWIFPHKEVAPGFTDPSDLSRLKYVKCFNFGPNVNSGSCTKVSHYVSARQIADKNMVDDQGFTAVYNANPTYRTYWIVYVDSSQWATEADIYMDVKIKYYCILSKPSDFNES